MKPLIKAIVTAAALASLTGCASLLGAQHGGALYTDVHRPFAVGPGLMDGNGGKWGVATSTSILGLVALGDSSIDAAMTQGKITKIHHVDYRLQSVFGLVATYTVIVYGE